MKNKLLKMTVLGFASYALVAGQVSAAPIFFNDRAAFDAAAGLLNFESFEGDWLNGGSSASFGGFTLSETGGTNIIHRASDWSSTIGASITDGNEAAFYQDNGNSAGHFFSFTSPVTAFGLDITANFDATVDIMGSVTDTLGLSNNVSSFWGVIDSAGLSTITFDAISGFGTGNAGWDGIGFDAVSFGVANPVPEPATALLFGTVLVGMAGSRLRRKRTKKTA